MKSKSIKASLIVTFICSLTCAKQLNAQEINIDMSYLQGLANNQAIELFKGGAEISASYTYKHNNFNYLGGLNFRTVQWGNQLSVLVGVQKSIQNNLYLEALLHNGMVLFYNRSLYAGAGELKANYEFLHLQKLSIGVFVGMRYTICPAYRNYGFIHQVLEIPIGFRFKF